MRMLFRTFGGFVKQCDLRSSVFSQDHRGMEDENVGLAIIHSDTKKYNQYCGCFSDFYAARKLSDEADWQKTMRDAIEFMFDYTDIGCVTYSYDDGRKSEILVDDARHSLYNDYGCPFYIIFGAQPMLGTSNDKNVIIGHDIYSLSYCQRSVIVWNLDRYLDFGLDDYSLYGFSSDPNFRDELCCLRNGVITRIR